MGGKFFKGLDGTPLGSRIPNFLVNDLTKRAMSLFAPFCEKMEMIISDISLKKKKDHGDIDFVCLPKPNGREDIRQYCKERGIPVGANGPMEHILFPIEKTLAYQIDLIFSSDPETYETIKYFYGKDITYNSIVGQFARSIGYIFSTDGFFRLVRDARKQNRKFLLIKNLKLAYGILGLVETPDEILFKSPETFADWIASSPRFDSNKFVRAHNKNAHRDAKKDTFCDQVYQILDSSGIVSSIPFYNIDFTKEVDLEKALEFEKPILGDDIAEKLLEFLKNLSFVKTPIISGDVIISLGYPAGPMIGKIIQTVSARFSVEDSEEDKIRFIKENFPIEPRNN